jgi:hypothetical protein
VIHNQQLSSVTVDTSEEENHAKKTEHALITGEIFDINSMNSFQNTVTCTARQRTSRLNTRMQQWNCECYCSSLGSS